MHIKPVMWEDVGPFLWFNVNHAVFLY
jgi:hypothetical protein